MHSVALIRSLRRRALWCVMEKTLYSLTKDERFASGFMKLNRQYSPVEEATGGGN